MAAPEPAQDDKPTAEPSLISGQLKQAQGAIYSAIGANLSSDPTWKSQGEELSKAGAEELEQVKAQADGDRLWGKAQSAFGAITGDQETLDKGNQGAEKAEWSSALAEGKLPDVSLERAKGKIESAKRLQGSITGDQEKQVKGNQRAEMAEWTGK